MLWAKQRLRYQGKASAGFTIIELLIAIAIAIIAILAAITIVAYNGATTKVYTAVLQSDLSQSYKTLGIDQVTNGSYPNSQSGAHLKASPGDTLTYSPNSNGYCLQASGHGRTYFVTNANNVPQSGTCQIITPLIIGSVWV